MKQRIQGLPGKELVCLLHVFTKAAIPERFGTGASMCVGIDVHEGATWRPRMNKPMRA